MRRITVSILAIIVASSAWGDVRLPVVNVASVGVSARAAFGEPIVESRSVSVEPVIKETRVASKPSTRSVVARSATKSKKSNVSHGEKTAAVADVLVPHRPSSDLWATNDAPLRMPMPSEFSVLNSDFNLPEENLDMSGVQRTLVARNSAPVTKHETISEIDSQMARLMELQRRADESIAEKPSQIMSAPIAKNNMKQSTSDGDTAIKLSRLVVPMESDVVERKVEESASPRIATVRNDMASMSPSELRRAFRKTFLSENKHLSTFQIDDRFDVASDMSKSVEGFTAIRDLSESGGIRPLEIKIRFRNDDSALSRDNYTLLTEYASIVVSNPKRAIQVAIPADATTNADSRKLAARRLAIIEQVLRDTGVSEQRILPVLSSRKDDGFLLRIISNDQFETLTQQQRDMFGDMVNKKTYKSMSW